MHDLKQLKDAIRAAVRHLFPVTGPLYAPRITDAMVINCAEALAEQGYVVISTHELDRLRHVAESYWPDVERLQTLVSSVRAPTQRMESTIARLQRLRDDIKAMSDMVRARSHAGEVVGR